MSDAPERIWACVSKNTKSGLVAVLGGATFPVDGWQEYVRADRIEALTEQLAAARQDAEEAEAYAEESEAKLAKAVEAAEEMSAAFYSGGNVTERHLRACNAGVKLHAALAEIKGESR